MMLVGAQGDKQVMSFVQKTASDVVSGQAQAVWGKNRSSHPSNPHAHDALFRASFSIRQNF
jgi:hypothetical protein